MEPAKAWIVLVGAGLLEIVWAIAFKYAEGFRRPVPTAIGVIGAAASLYLLTRALEALPVGTAYAVWMGIGAFGVAIVGIVALGESASPLRLGCILLILLGVAGLRATES
jgi:quaternary ammonium compound-resistance protein SugE